MNFMQLLTENLFLILSVSIILAVLIVLLWRNYDIEEITPTPPFIKLKRKAKSINEVQKTTINITGNKMFGKNKIAVRRENANASDNAMLGENEIEVGAKPGRKSKETRKKK